MPWPCSCHGRRLALGSGRPIPGEAASSSQTPQCAARGPTVADARRRDAPAGSSGGDPAANQNRDPALLLVTHDFASAEQAGSFAHDPALRDAMGRAGVEAAPRIEIFTDV